jgi:hypothetical protein
MKRAEKQIALYTVWLKRGGPAFVQAIGYIEQKRAGRIYFHLDGDCKNREVFFKTSEIVGITVEGKPAIPGAGRKEIEKWWKKVAKVSPSKTRV